MKPTRKPEPPPSEIETFSDPRGYRLASLVRDAPSCFNGIIEIRRYRVSVYEIPEPPEVLVPRLRKLWRECDNWYHWKPMHAVAKQLGIQLDHDEFGKDRKKRS